MDKLACTECGYDVDDRMAQLEKYKEENERLESKNKDLENAIVSYRIEQARHESSSVVQQTTRDRNLIVFFGFVSVTVCLTALLFTGINAFYGLTDEPLIEQTREAATEMYEECVDSLELEDHQDCIPILTTATQSIATLAENSFVSRMNNSKVP